MEHSAAMLIAYNLEDVAKLPAAECEWRSRDLEREIGRSLITRLRTDDLIVKIDTGVYRTSQKLEDYLESKHGVTMTADAEQACMRGH